jgi:hypothetical protein
MLDRPALSSHFSPGLAPQVGQLIARIGLPWAAIAILCGAGQQQDCSIMTSGFRSVLKTASTFVMWRPRLDVSKPDLILDSSMWHLL